MNSDNNNNNSNDIQVIDFSGMNVGPTPQNQSTNTMMDQAQVIPQQPTEIFNNQAPSLEVPVGEQATPTAPSMDAQVGDSTVSSAPVDSNPLPSSEAESVNTVSEEPIVDNGNQTMVNPEPMTGTDVSNISYENKDAYNEFADKKPAKKGNKLTTILLIFLVLLVAGVALWYFCIYKNTGSVVGGSSNNNAIKALDVNLELGDPIPTTITTYINRDLKQTEYKLITSKINNNEIGDYEFSVTYNNETYTGTCHVQDTKGPQLVINNVISKDLQSLQVNSFVSSCEDISGCELSFADPNVLSNINEKGTYDIDIKAVDTAGNSTVLTASLSYDPSANINRLSCTKDGAYKKFPTANLKATYVLNFDENDKLDTINYTKDYVFTNKDDFSKFKDEKVADCEFDDAKLSCLYKKNYTHEEVLNDTSVNDIPSDKTKASKYLEENGYKCN